MTLDLLNLWLMSGGWFGRAILTDTESAGYTIYLRHPWLWRIGWPIGGFMLANSMFFGLVLNEYAYRRASARSNFKQVTTRPHIRETDACWCTRWCVLCNRCTYVHASLLQGLRLGLFISGVVLCANSIKSLYIIENHSKVRIASTSKCFEKTGSYDAIWNKNIFLTIASIPDHPFLRLNTSDKEVALENGSSIPTFTHYHIDQKLLLWTEDVQKLSIFEYLFL